MTELILALDVSFREEAHRIAEITVPYLDAIKIGYPLVLAEGLRVAEELSDYGLPLIADFKVADIPNTTRLIAQEVFSKGFSAIICHGFVGVDSVSVCAEVAHDNRGQCYVVCEMSHPGATEFFHGGVAERLATMVCETGSDGIIAPATRPERVAVLRSLIGDRKILSPGVGAQGGDPAAITELVDGIIVGRAIYDSPDPAAAARSYRETISSPPD